MWAHLERVDGHVYYFPYRRPEIDGHWRMFFLRKGCIHVNDPDIFVVGIFL